MTVCWACFAGDHSACVGVTVAQDSELLIPCDCTRTDNHPQTREAVQ